MTEIKDTLKKIGLSKTRRKIKSNRRQLIYERDGHKCRYCDKIVEYHKFHADHINPRSNWGNDYVFNLCVSCPECNLSKGSDASIVPEPLSFVKRIYEIYLIVKYNDYPKLEDYL